MGIQDRDYYREGPSFLDRVGEQGATVWLIAVTCGVFFGQMFTGMLRSPLVEVGAYDPNRILEGEVWRLLTGCFLHSTLWHIFFNMLILFWAGQRLEERYGSFEFVLFYLFSGVLANVLYLAAQVAGAADMSRAVGASGAVTAALILFACNYPHTQVRLYFFIPMPVWLLAILFVGFDVLFATSVADPRGGRIAYFAHIGGAAVGLVYYQTGFEFRRLFARKSRPRARPQLRVISPPVEDDMAQPVAAAVPAAARPAEAADEQLEAKLDAVLAKVSKHGQESLTPEEREILFRASELYKKRRK